MERVRALKCEFSRYIPEDRVAGGVQSYQFVIIYRKKGQESNHNQSVLSINHIVRSPCPMVYVRGVTENTNILLLLALVSKAVTISFTENIDHASTRT